MSHQQQCRLPAELIYELVLFIPLSPNIPSLPISPQFLDPFLEQHLERLRIRKEIVDERNRAKKGLAALLRGTLQTFTDGELQLYKSVVFFEFEHEFKRRRDGVPVHLSGFSGYVHFTLAQHPTAAAEALANDLQNLQVTLRAMNDGQLQLYKDAVLSVFEQERQSRLHAMQSQGQIQQENIPPEQDTTAGQQSSQQQPPPPPGSLGAQ